MLFGIIIQARHGSKRFLKKILQKIDHRLVIEFMLDYLEKKFKKNNIIVATTIKKQDNKLVRLLKKREINSSEVLIVMFLRDISNTQKSLKSKILFV